MATRYFASPPPRTMPLPQTDARAFGADVAEGLADVGRAAGRAAANAEATAERVAEIEHRAALIEHERKQQFERSARLVDYARISGEIQTEVLELRAKAGPGAAGYADAVRKIVDERLTPWLDAIPDPEVRADFAPRAASLGASLAVSAEEYEIGSRADLAKTNYEDLVDQVSNNVFTNPAPDSVAAARETVRAYVENAGLPGNASAALLKDANAKIARNTLLGFRRDNPEAGLEMLRRGIFNADLDADQVAAIENALQAEADQRASRAMAAQAAADKEFEEGARLLLDRAGAGLDVDPVELADASRQAAAMGDERLALDLSIAAEKVNILSGTRTWVPAKYEAEINSLAGNDDDASRVRREALQAGLERTRAAMRADRLAARAERTGRPVPAIGTPERLAYMRADEAETGLPSRYFTRSEVDAVGARIERSAADRVQVARELADLGPGVAQIAARQVAPNNPLFNIAVDLAARVPDPELADKAARDVLLGADVLKANKALVDRAEANRIFREQALPAMAALPGQYKGEVLAAAMSIFAARMDREGQTEWQLGEDDASFRQAINVALGGVRLNGVWHGGIDEVNGRGVLLPPGIRASTFEARMSRATADDWVRAGNGAPVDNAGRPVPASYLKHLWPVAVGEGVYRLSNGDGFILREDGGAYEFSLRELGR